MTSRSKSTAGLTPTTLFMALLGLLLLAPPVAADGGRRHQPRRAKTHPALAQVVRDHARAGARRGALPQAAMVDVIVRYRNHPGVAEERRVRGLGSRVKRQFKNLPMMALRVPAARLHRLAEHYDVEFVDPDSPIEATSLAAKKTARVPGAGREWKVLAMPDVGVAVIDSGVADHWDLNVAGRVDCLGDLGCRTAGRVSDRDDDSDEADAWSTAADTHDAYGHGTHIAGIIGGTGKGKSPAEAGVAPWAPIFSLRVLDGQGKGQASDLIAALDWVLENAAERQIRVINLSLGTALEEPAGTDPLVEAVEVLWDAGIVVVCSAGNHGRSGSFTITSPANSPKVITVGSITDGGTGDDFADDHVSTYSSRGPTLIDHYLKPDLLAPGNRVVAPIAPGKLQRDLPARVRSCRADSCSGNNYLELSGTSMAAAMVSGAAALMISREPHLNPASVKARLMRSARKVKGDPVAVGAGVLDVEAALAETGWTKRSPSPRLARGEEGPVLVIEDTRRTWFGDEWDANLLWGGAFVWSDSFVSAEGYVWSDAFLWSDAFVWSDALVWADGFLWADAFIWSDAFVWSDAVSGDDPLYIEANSLTLADDGPSPRVTAGRLAR